MRYTHTCSGASKYDDKSRDKLKKGDKHLHAPLGFESENLYEPCPDCGDDTQMRGSYNVVELE